LTCLGTFRTFWADRVVLADDPFGVVDGEDPLLAAL
jgi:hypothetical protein